MSIIGESKNEEEIYYYKVENDSTTESKTFEAEFETVDSGASNCYPISIHDIKKGSYVVMENRPCRVTDIDIVKVGKHGHAKASITGEDIFNEKKYCQVCPASNTKYAPEIKRTEHTIMTVDDEQFISLVDSKGIMKQDLKLPNFTEHDEVVSNRIKKGIETGKVMIATVLTAMGLEKIEDARESTDQI